MTILISTLADRLQSLLGDYEGAYANRYLDSINDACRETYPRLHRKIVNTELITGNILPPFNWPTTATLDAYTVPTGTLLKTTTAGYIRGGVTSAKVTASGADDSIVLDSNAYPRLLDLMDKVATLKCWCLAQNASDSFLDIVTTDSAGADTTESSTTTSTAAMYTLIEIEDYDVPDDITRLRVNLRTHTDTKYVYFAQPRLMGSAVYEYMLPDELQNGDVKQVWIQTSGYSDDICDDLHPKFGEEVFGWTIIDDGTYKYLRMPYLSTGKRLKLIGCCPLEDDSDATTDTISMDDKYIPTLLYYAAHSVYEKVGGIVSGDSRTKYQEESMRWLWKYEKMGLRMPRIPGQIHWSLDG